jgi:5-methylcytosine-specific restriction endonuclease McrA
MPIKPENKKLYPENWKQISKRIRFERAKNKCEVCGAENYRPHPETGSRVVLTVAHLDHDPQNNKEDNLKAMCQRCHLKYDTGHHAKTRRATRNKKHGFLELPFCQTGGEGCQL